MAEKLGSFRTTISVPLGLKARMDRVKEPVNWSALACRAFEAKLAEIAAGKENKVMCDVVERLRASLRSEQGQSFNEGYEAGTRWAENKATAAELTRLQRFQKSNNAQPRDGGGPDWFWLHGAHKPWLELVMVIQDNKNPRLPGFAFEFWKTVLGEEHQKSNDGDLLRGFVNGAVDIWAKVQKLL